LAPACTEVDEVLTPLDDAGTLDAAGGSTSDAELPDAGPEDADVDASDAFVPEPGTSDAVQVDAGDNHTCAVFYGALYCWGQNQRGQLGLGDSSNRDRPERVGARSDWAEVTTAAEHSCALAQDGSVWCFGANDRGQLSGSGVNDVLVPRRVALEAAALQVSAESDFSCARLDSGALYCWGENTEGQLGQDDTYPGADEFSPLRVADFDDWTYIDAGQGHACGLRAPGSLWCWGRNSDVQLGTGPDTPVQFRFPEPVGSETDFALVQAGQMQSCAIREAGELSCWGRNDFGNLGTGDLDPRLVPTTIGTGGYAQMSLDTFHACAVDRSGTLACWGRNVEGQLGLGDNEDRVSPSPVPGSGWVQVAVGRFHTCAVRSDDSIWCTGENDSGRLGVSDLERRNAFTRVLGPSG
jgi:alpha-tubulin suppressor-like RCC1 family protein